VLSQYQRRADLVPNIVATVKGEAAFEQETLTRVIEARAKATSIQVTPGDAQQPAGTPEISGRAGRTRLRLEPFDGSVGAVPQPQGQPGICSDLRVQLEGTENRITVARNRYIQAIQSLQRAGAQLSQQPDGHAVQLPA
jgi:LemA protein